MLFSLYVFFLIFPYLISSSMFLWSEKVPDIIFLLNFLKLVLWLNKWSILQNVPHALEKNYLFSILRMKCFKISVQFIWSNVTFKAIISLLIFPPHELSTNVSEVLKYSAIIVLLRISLLMYINIYFICLGASMVWCIDICDMLTLNFLMANLPIMYFQYRSRNAATYSKMIGDIYDYKILTRMWVIDYLGRLKKTSLSYLYPL